MKLDSKLFDMIRASRRRPDETVAGPPCAWPGCEEVGTHRAPLGRDREGEYTVLCLEHVKAYNRTYNYFEGMSEAAIAAYQKDAVTGHRPTSRMGLGPDRRAQADARTHRAAWSGLYDDPFDLFRASRVGAAGMNGNGASGVHDAGRAAERRRVSVAESRAFEVLGLPDDASKEGIKARYKALVKRHHPDANNGDRSSEARLRSVINAYAVLRRSGYC